ncbi:MAG: MOSC domain-containing protein [Marinobacter sp.]|uniref:MOSC domain-containing protein n=1 Tax=Marinobacter sp. TaxID=50741 RepID=UPI00299DDCCE|nr:MOSC N-terminal beta barrel domain-containing protein [Marinobacter sp.]MDX1635908.1 MOSC domain-containing protein [Marinobacter sp.]
MQIQSLFLYPVKSLAGIEVDSLALDEFGPAGDRRWMITDPLGRFMTQRDYPQLARVAVSVDSEGVVTLRIPDEGSHTLIRSGATRNVMVWDDWLAAQRAEPGPAEALGRFLDMEVDLVYVPDDTFRPVDRVWVRERRRVGFADGYPFLVVNQASLDELNTRLQQPVEMRRFRPNIVVSGASAWAEDTWPALTSNNVRLELVKPCSRCVMTTVDPDLGVKAPDQQPLRTLGQYRRLPGGVIFGMNAIHTGDGPLEVGQPVTLT